MITSSSNSTVLTSTLICPICSKATASHTSLQRHITYCRKARNRPQIRYKACQCCHAAKAKCSFQTPCRRCEDKGLQCLYNQLATRTTPLARNATHVIESSVLQQGIETSSKDSFLDSGTFDSMFAGISNDNGEESVIWPQTGPSWSSDQLSIVLESSDQGLQEGISTLPWISPHIFSHSIAVPETTYAVPQPMHQYPDCLAYIPKQNLADRQISRLIGRTLRTYPLMMLRRETFPPFIHPHWHRRALPTPLANCMGIAQLFALRSVETRPFLWHMIKTEAQIFRNKMNSYSSEELLAGIQAQTIYMIMRVVDQSTEPTGLNLEVLTTFKMLCVRYRTILEQDAAGALPDNGWQNWLHSESKRRSTLVLYLIGLVAFVSTGTSCGIIEDYRNLRLCSPRTVWDARTEADWASELEASTVREKADKLHTLGHLADANDASHIPNKVEALDGWIARADGLGNLLSAVMTLGCSKMI